MFVYGEEISTYHGAAATDQGDAGIGDDTKADRKRTGLNRVQASVSAVDARTKKRGTEHTQTAWTQAGEDIGGIQV